MSTQQEQKQGVAVVAVVAKPATQEQKQGVPPDPVQEQKQSYSPPENAIASDPITEVTKEEEPVKEEQKKE